VWSLLPLGGFALPKPGRSFFFLSCFSLLIGPLSIFVTFSGNEALEAVALQTVFSLIFAPSILLHALGLSQRDMLAALDRSPNSPLIHIVFWFSVAVIFLPLFVQPARMSQAVRILLCVLAGLFVLLTLKGCATMTVCEGGC
jgi:hypothetical protein